MWYLFWCVVAGAAEFDRPPVVQGAVVVGRVRVALEVVEEPVITALVVGQGADRAVLAGAPYAPTRVSLSPSGAMAAFVSGYSGFSSVYVVPTDGSAAPRQLTNVGVRHTKAGRPEGFVDPPAAPPVFEGEWLVWKDAVGGAHRVRWSK